MTDSTMGAHVPWDVSLDTLVDADLPTRIAALEALCGAISSTDIQDERDAHTGIELGEASVRVHRACARLTGKRYQWLAAEEADGRWSTSAFRPRTFASHVARTHGISYGNARQLVRLARQLRDEIPQFGAALRAGEVGPDHVAAFASTALTSSTRVAALDEQVELEDEQATSADGDDAPGSDPSPGQDHAEDGSPTSDDPEAEAHSEAEADREPRTVTVETLLLQQARQLRPDQVRRLGKHFAQVADPEADDRGYHRAKEREYVELVRTLDGWHLSGFLTEENGRLVRTAMEAAMTPPAPDDQRTGDQRRAQALADLAHLVLDQGLVGNRASVRPHLGVLIGPGDFERLLRESGASRKAGASGKAGGSRKTGGSGQTGASGTAGTTQQNRSEQAQDSGEQGSSTRPHSHCPATGGTGTGTEGLATPPAPDRGDDRETDRRPERESDGAPAQRIPREPDREPEQNRPLDPAPDTDPSSPDEPQEPAARSGSAPPGQRNRTGGWDPAALAELATIDWVSRLSESPPRFDDGTGPVPPGLLQRLAGCGDVYRVLFSPEGEVLNLGRSHRVFTPAQRRALVARDHGCTWPGCTAPPSICESHHARVHWADGGPTDVTNGALLCYHHHDVVDARSIAMTRQDGTWIFTRPDGTVLNTDRYGPTAPQGWSLAG